MRQQWIATCIIAALATTANAGEILKLQTGETSIHNLNKMQVAPLMADVGNAQDFIIQYKNVITAADKAELKALGAEIFRYIPDDALIVRGNRSEIEKHFEGNAKIQGFASYNGDYKISSNVPALSIFSRGQKEVVLITTFKASDVDKIASNILAMDPEAIVVEKSDRYLSLGMDQSLISALPGMAGVEFVQKIEEMIPLHYDMGDDVDLNKSLSGDYTDLTGFETGTKVMNMDAMWDLGYTGSGQIVGMADTGLDVGNIETIHQDFKGGVQSGNGFAAASKNWSDPMGHGTHVAGSVMGRGLASGGKLRGAGFSAKLVAQGMWSTVIDNLLVPSKLSKLFSAAYDDGARIHTNSWGSAQSFGVYDSMAQQVDDFMWKNPEMLIMYAAGNSGCDLDKNGVIDHGQIGTPATSKNSLSVGASENLEDKGGIQKQVSELRGAKDCWGAEPIWSSKLSDNAKGIAVFSSRGPTKDKRLKPEIVAPGTNILSVKSRAPGAEVLWGAYSEDYVWSGGTSMATPLAAGAAAVARDFIQKKWKVAQPSAALVKALMLHTATDLAPGQYGTGSALELTARPNMDQGYGIVDMNNLATSGASIKFSDEKSGLATGESKEFTLSVSKSRNGAAKVLVNLAYTDAPGTPSAGAALVNNLDIEVAGPDGKVVAPADKINNHEIVEIKNAKVGVYKITVKGSNVPMGLSNKQPYALVYSVL